MFALFIYGPKHKELRGLGPVFALFITTCRKRKPLVGLQQRMEYKRGFICWIEPFNGQPLMVRLPTSTPHNLRT